MVSILLNSSAFLPFDAESTAFWVLLAIMAGSLFISYIDEENPMRSLLLNFLCAGATFLFSGLRGELFWFLNIEKVGLLLWVFCYILTFMFFGVIAGINKQTIIVTKSFLIEDADWNSRLDTSRLKEIDAKKYRIEKAKPFDEKDLSTIRTYVESI